MLNECLGTQLAVKAGAGLRDGPRMDNGRARGVPALAGEILSPQKKKDKLHSAFSKPCWNHPHVSLNIP